MFYFLNMHCPSRNCSVEVGIPIYWAPTNWREGPGRFTRKVGGGGAPGLVSPLLDHKM